MPSAFKVMTWNLENLFLPGEEGGPEDQAVFDEKLAALVTTILQLSPDVLAVQEVGSEAAFGVLQDALEGHYPHARLSSVSDGRGIRVGFLSRLPIEEHEDFADFPGGPFRSVPGLDRFGNPESVTRMGRGALRVVVRPAAGLLVHLVTAHLKSKLLTFPSTSGEARFSPRSEDERAYVAGLALLRRTAEAVTLRVKANALLSGNQGRALILLGDLNDVTDAATTQLLQGPPGSEIGTTGFDRPDKGDDTRLFNLAPLIPMDRRYSRTYRGNNELIDHILISEDLLPGEPHRVPLADSHVDLFGDLPSITDQPRLRRDKPQSDHAPITATFEL
jgi:endonuclease/exonuclease/phosphatase family metal-dependent hydrolase